MIDTRCYNCVENRNEMYIDFEDENYKPPIFQEKEYKGNGVFICPKCGDVIDKSKSTYTIEIERKYDEDHDLYTEFLKLDSKLNGDKKIAFEEDMIEFDIFEKIPIGKYKIEVLWYYYQCGGEETEWDVEIEILSEKEI